MIPTNGSSFGRAGGRLRRYPGGTENDSIFATVRGSMPKRRAASRLLIPSIRTAKRTFAYSSTPFIPQPSAFNAKSFLPPEFYSGATGQPGHFSEGFCLRRVHPRGIFAFPPLGGMQSVSLQANVVGLISVRRKTLPLRQLSAGSGDPG